jgi:hypothetical protein
MTEPAMQDAVDYARRLAGDTAHWQHVASAGPAAADAEWQQVLAAVRQIVQQLESIYKLTLTESEAQAFLASPLESVTLRRAPAQVLLDEYSMPADGAQWRLRGTLTFAIHLGPQDVWLWRGGDGALFSSAALANLAVLNLLRRERAHRGIPEGHA